MEQHKQSGKFETKKSLGQHFLNNPSVPNRMADVGDVGEEDIVLEIGPGTGALTEILLLRGATVIAVETDARAITELKKRFTTEITAQKLVIREADMRSTELADFGLKEHRYKVIANIPYYLSGMLFRTFLETSIQPSSIVFLVQKEVAERIARDKKESLLSLSVKAYGTPKYITTVKRTHFSPPPKVDSAIICIDNISHDRFEEIDESFFFEILHLGFAARRKQLLGNLSQKFQREKLVHIFSTLGIQPTVRGEDLEVATWLNLTSELAVLHSPQ